MNRGLAAPGTYRVRITSSVAGVTRTFSRAVTVATKLVNVTRSASRYGYDSTDAATQPAT